MRPDVNVPELYLIKPTAQVQSVIYPVNHLHDISKPLLCGLKGHAKKINAHRHILKRTHLQTLILSFCQQEEERVEEWEGEEKGEERGEEKKKADHQRSGLAWIFPLASQWNILSLLL